MDDEEGSGEAAATRRWLAMLKAAQSAGSAAAAAAAAAGNPNWTGQATVSSMHLAGVFDNSASAAFNPSAQEQHQQHQHQQLQEQQQQQLQYRLGRPPLSAPAGLMTAGATGQLPYLTQSFNGNLEADASSTWSLLIGTLFYKSDTFDTNWINVLSAVAIIVLFSATVIGNSFVIMAILIERNLRTIGNYLVLSLAIADLLVALLVMPMAGIYQILDRWTLGVTYCEIWTSADVFCCTASILHLLAIALDRYWAVTRVDYIRCQRNEKRILFMIFFVWTAACIISMAPVFGWKDDQFEWRITNDKECLISQDIGYQIFATCTTFYFPLILTLIFYWKIYQVARRRIRRKTGNRVKISLQHPSSSSSTSSPSSRQLQRTSKAASSKQHYPSATTTTATATTTSTSAYPSLVECATSQLMRQKSNGGGLLANRTDVQLESDQKQHPGGRRKQIMLAANRTASGRCSPLATSCQCSCHIQLVGSASQQPSSSSSASLQGKLMALGRQAKGRTASESANSERPSKLRLPSVIHDDPPIEPSESSKTAVGDRPIKSSAPVANSDGLAGAGTTTEPIETTITQTGAQNLSTNKASQPTQANRCHCSDANHRHHHLVVKSNEEPESSCRSAGQLNLNVRTMLASAVAERSCPDVDNQILGTTAINNDNLIQLSAAKRQSIREAGQTSEARNLVESPGALAEQDVSEAGTGAEAEAAVATTTTTTADASAPADYIGEALSKRANETSLPERRFSCAQCKKRSSPVEKAVQLGARSPASSNGSLGDRSSDNTADRESCWFVENINSNNNNNTNGDFNEAAKRQKQFSEIMEPLDDCCECCCDQNNNHHSVATTANSLSPVSPAKPLVPKSGSSDPIIGEQGERQSKRASCIVLADKLVRSELIPEPPSDANAKRAGARLLLNGGAAGAELNSQTGDHGAKRKRAHLSALFRNTPIALYWLQLQFQFANKGDNHKTSAQSIGSPDATTAVNHNGPNQAHPNSTSSILVDRTGQSALVSVCRLCQCRTTSSWPLAGDKGATRDGQPEEVVDDDQQDDDDDGDDDDDDEEETDDEQVENAGPIVVVDEPCNQQAATRAELSNQQDSGTRASGMVIAASTANIAVSTVGPPHMASSTVVANSVQTQHAAEGIESKRERKAAKTLSIITGVFVICWLPFFIMAILMPMLNIKPHKFLFALLLWLGYFNSMLNPIIYTIFSPDFRKAFKRLLCGRLAACWRRRMQQQEMVAEMAANKRANNITLDQGRASQSGYLGRLQRWLLAVNPLMLPCCQPTGSRTKAPLISAGAGKGGGGGSSGGWGKRTL